MAAKQRPWIESSLPVLGMASAVIALAINQIISKMAMSKGTSFYILSVYSNGLATLVLFPTAFLFHRSKRPPLSFPVLWRIFLLASFGCSAEVGSYAGISYSSDTRYSHVDSCPGIHIHPCYYFQYGRSRFEKIQYHCQVFWYFSIHLRSIYRDSLQGSGYPQCAIDFYIYYTTLLAISTKLDPGRTFAGMCLFYDSIMVHTAERDLAALRIQTKVGLMAVFYAAIINIAYRLYVTAWCISETGPFFVSLFKPLTIVIAIVIGVIFVKDVLYLGSLLGALVLIVGFYAVMWGKAKEREINVGIESSNYQAPLLQDNIQLV